jgi:hypothetical protein
MHATPVHLPFIQIKRMDLEEESHDDVMGGEPWRGVVLLPFVQVPCGIRGVSGVGCLHGIPHCCCSPLQQLWLQQWRPLWLQRLRPAWPHQCAGQRRGDVHRCCPSILFLFFQHIIKDARELCSSPF